MTYESLDLKKPIESDDYQECSEFVVTSIEAIMKEAMDTGRNKIVINTNLKLGIPMENVNKIAGPFVEAWAFEVFTESLEGSGKSPNITSFARIRSAYIKDPDYIFVILSIKHRVFSTRDEETKMMMGVMETYTM